MIWKSNWVINKEITLKIICWNDDHYSIKTSSIDMWNLEPIGYFTTMIRDALVNDGNVNLNELEKIVGLTATFTQSIAHA